MGRDVKKWENAKFSLISFNETYQNRKSPHTVWQLLDILSSSLTQTIAMMYVWRLDGVFFFLTHSVCFSCKYKIFSCPHWTMVLGNLYEFIIRHLSKQFGQVGVFKGIFLVNSFLGKAVFTGARPLRGFLGLMPIMILENKKIPIYRTIFYI